jgi:hypothetical protein
VYTGCLMVELARTFGPIVYGMIMLGLASVVFGVLALALSKSKTGVYSGFAALVLVLASSTISVFGVMHARIEAQKAADAVDPSLREQVLARGHQESLGFAKVGVAFGGIGLVLGAIGLVKSLMNDDKKGSPASATGSDQGAAWMRPFEGTRGLAALVLSGLALFSLIGAGMPFLVKPPTGSEARGDPERKLVDAAHMLEEGNFDAGCTAIEQAFADGVNVQRSGLKNVESMVSECFEQKLGKAESGADAAERTRILTALRDTRMPLQESQRERVKTALAASRE